jgi:hypothetical protein
MIGFRKAGIVGLAASLLTLAAATSPADIAHGKFLRIEEGKLPPGARIDVSAVEMTAWAVDEGRLYAPGAVRNIRLELTANAATGSMLVDFVKLRQAATGQAPGWLMKNLFAGERPVTVSGRFESRNGRARVDVDRVEVSGVLIEGTTLDFVIQNFLRPTFPDVKVNQWFQLGFHMDRFTVSPEGVSVFIGR